MRIAVAWIFVCAIGLLAGCSSSDAPVPSAGPSPTDSPEAAVVQPGAEESPSTNPSAEPAGEAEVEKATAAGPVMDEKTGIAVGQKAPLFRLNDQNGKPRSLEEFTAQGNVALVFYRSADW